jgi:CRP/FNR family transcriptional regulator, cyclic AMP receptor protein
MRGSKAMSDITKKLREHAFFADLSDENIRTISDCGHEKTFSPGEVIAKEGSDANDFFLVKKGKLAIQIFTPHQGAVTVHTVGDNDIVGWSWLFPPYKWCFDIKVMEATSVIALNAQCLRGKCESDHELGYKLMKKFSQIMIQRLHETRIQLLDIYG